MKLSGARDIGFMLALIFIIVMGSYGSVRRIALERRVEALEQHECVGIYTPPCESGPDGTCRHDCTAGEVYRPERVTIYSPAKRAEGVR